MNNDDDNEFDELFSFTSTATTFESKASPAISDNEGTNNDLNSEKSTRPSNQKVDESSSFVNVSPIGEGDDDDVFGDFDLNTVTLAGNKLKLVEDDFHTMDAETREMLEFLEHEPTGSVSHILQDAKQFLDLNLEDDDMDYVDIQVDHKRPNDIAKCNEIKESIDLVDNLFNKGADDIMEDHQNDEQATSLESSQQRSSDAEMKESPTNPVASTIQDSHTHLSEPSWSTDMKNDSDNLQGLAVDEIQTPSPKTEMEHFNSLSDAILSQTSSMSQIRPLMFPAATDIQLISEEERPHLWTKAICSKTLYEVEQSSLADSFSSWHKSFDFDSLQSKENIYKFGLPEVFIRRILDEVGTLVPQILREGMNDTTARRDLCSVMIYYYRSVALSKSIQSESSIDSRMKPVSNDLDLKEEVSENLKQSPDSNSEIVESSIPKNSTGTNLNADIEWNPFIGPVITMLLKSNLSVSVTSVLLSRILPTFMPLVSLSQEERVLGAKSLHQTLYYLISYHLPLLVLHLDRHAPGWFWPSAKDGGPRGDDEEVLDDNGANKGANFQSRGLIPINWFLTMFVGARAKEILHTSNLIELWDILLASNDNSLKFFLAAAIFESHSDRLLSLKGNDLVEEVKAITSIESDESEEASFFGNSSSERTAVQLWYSNAKKLQAATPPSVVIELSRAEDDSVDRALAYRSKIAMDGIKARLEVEAEAHRRAVEEENVQKLNERMEKYYKDRLLNFYKKNCPEKVESVDKIMTVYHDRYEELDAKLHAKYGSGFLPLVSIFNPKVASQTSKIFSSVGHGIERKKKNLIAARAEEKSQLLGDFWKETQRKHQVALKVSASDVLPGICGGKVILPDKGANEYIKFYLVDSRSSDCRMIQGSFPTAASLTPEDLMEPEIIQEKVEMFEALRGAVHIVVMVRTFSIKSAPLVAFSNHIKSIFRVKAFQNFLLCTITLWTKMRNGSWIMTNPVQVSLITKIFYGREKRSKLTVLCSLIDTCALFFIKKGFPFVSVLDGGFAAAHAWLKRDCHDLSISKILVDYDEETSPFADLERSYQEQKEFLNASASKKTTLTMQRFIDNSMARLASAEKSLEEFTNRSHAVKDEVTASSIEDTKIENKSNDIKTGIKNAFAGIKSRRSNADSKPDIVDIQGAKGFDIKKLTFGRKEKNRFLEKTGSIFSKKKTEDKSLEHEVIASLKPIEMGEQHEIQSKSGLHKLKIGLGKKSTADERHTNDTIKNIASKKIEKSTSLNTTNAYPEEESILFED